jgi:hypothetical protein
MAVCNFGATEHNAAGVLGAVLGIHPVFSFACID